MLAVPTICSQSAVISHDVADTAAPVVKSAQYAAALICGSDTKVNTRKKEPVKLIDSVGQACVKLSSLGPPPSAAALVHTYTHT